MTFADLSTGTVSGIIPAMPRVVQVAGFLVEVTDESVHQVGAPPLSQTTGSGIQPSTSGSTKMGGARETAANAADTVANVGVAVSNTIASVCNYVQEAMSKFNRPAEMKLKFGLKIAGEAGIPYLTKGSGEAVLEIEATWKNPASEGPTGTEDD